MCAIFATENSVPKWNTFSLECLSSALRQCHRFFSTLLHRSIVLSKATRDNLHHRGGIMEESVAFAPSSEKF